jgi:hypothetical protein
MPGDTGFNEPSAFLPALEIQTGSGPMMEISVSPEGYGHRSISAPNAPILALQPTFQKIDVSSFGFGVSNTS